MKTFHSLLLCAAALVAQPNTDVYLRHNLVSDLPANAEVKDPDLVNPWGIAASPTGPFWISDNGTGVSTVYDSNGRPFPNGNPLIVTIPGVGGKTSAPTGIVFNSGPGFTQPSGGPALFLFATEDGTIAGWNLASGNTATINITTPGAIYKGIAIAHRTSGDTIFAANFNSGMIDTYDVNFSPTGSFTDTSLPAGYAPFNVTNIGGPLYVSFALQDADKKDDVPGAGHGFIDVFNPDGTLQRRLVSNGDLNSPWGMVVAPSNFGAFSGSLLVGNFGDGTIHAYDVSTGALIGTMLEPSKRPMVIPGLWGLLFGNGANGGDIGVLYFTAGIPGPSGAVEDHGLFGQIRPQHP